MLRARIMLVGSDTVAITLMDGDGALVGGIESLALRGISPHRLRPNTIGDDALYQVDWIALTPHDGAIGVPSCDDATDNLTVLRCPETTTAGDALGDSTHRLLAHLLEQVQSWLSSDSHSDEARLVVITRGAIAVDTSEDVADLGQAAGWGLLRSAQNENPGRISLVDVDDWANADIALAGKLFVMSRNWRFAAAPSSHRGLPTPNKSPVRNSSTPVPGALSPSARERSTRETLRCSRGRKASARWGAARCVWACAAPG